MSATDIALESLQAARRHIETSADPVRIKLRRAIVRYLIELHPENFPDGVWPEFAALMDRVSRLEPEDDAGSVERTLNQMSDSEVADVIAKISQLQEKVTALAKR